MPLSPSTSLGRYQILSPLGAGGMGEVYLAHDARLNRKVALKVLPADLINNRERLHRFEQEARAASALNHPNIITIHEIGSCGDTHFIAMEYIDGETLRHKLQTARAEIEETLNIVPQIAAALDAAHRSGIVHRDIKPENVMVRADGLVKVLDFGLAKLTESKGDVPVDTEAPTRAQVQTMPGVVMGTAAYMSPEQARGKATDARTDVWSLGVVLYEMLTGQLPFEGETASDMIAAILKTEPSPLSNYLPDAPAELQRIVKKTLRKNPDERYQNAKDLQIDLRNLRRDLEQEAERLAAPMKATETVAAATKRSAEPSAETAHQTSSAESVVEEIKRHKLFSVALLILLIAIGGLGYWYFVSRSTNAKQIESIAVLPFVNESGNQDVEYLSDGMTETLISSLSQIPRLNIKARSSVFRYKGKDADVRTVGKELNVQAVLNGRVVERGQALALHIELVDTATEYVLWSGDYTGSLGNLVALQTDITRDVSSKLQMKLSGAEEQRVVRPATENAEAYQLYLRGRFFLLKLNEDGFKKALDLFNQALEKDPNYALAYVGIADYYYNVSNLFMPPKEALPKARAAAQKAISLDDTLAEAHAILGQTLLYDWDWANAERETKRAVELNPNSPRAHGAYAQYLTFMQRLDEAIVERRRALELDPLSASVSNNLGVAFFFARRYDEGITQLRQTIEIDQNYWLAYLYLGKCYLRKGDLNNSRAALEQARNLNENPFTLSNLGYLYAVTGQRDEARKILATLLEREKQRSVFPTGPAFIYAGLGDKEQTLIWLQKVVDERTDDAPWLRLFPEFDALHSDPRFQDLLRRVGLMS